MNASLDCGVCAVGFGNYPTCACSRHVSGTVDFTGLALTSDSAELDFLRGVIADLNAEIQAQCGAVSATDSTTGYVFEIRKNSGGTTAVITFDVQSLDASCTSAERVSDCVLALLLSGCFPLTQTNANGGKASCTLPQTSLRKSVENPCGQFGCAAAEESLVSNLAPTATPAPPSSGSGIPFWIWLVLVGGILLILVILGAAARYRMKRKSGIFFSDPGRYTKRFDVGVEEEELDTTQVVINDEDVETGREMEAKTKTTQFQDRMARQRGASRFAKDVDDNGNELEWESPNADQQQPIDLDELERMQDMQHASQPGYMLQGSDAPSRSRAYSDI